MIRFSVVASVFGVLVLVGCTSTASNSAAEADAGPTVSAEVAELSSENAVHAAATPTSLSPSAPSQQVASATPRAEGSLESGSVTEVEKVDSLAPTVLVSPIDSTLGFITDVDDLKRYLENASEEHARLVNECMLERGWDDFHYDAIRPYSELDFVATPYRRSEQELRRFGYGAVYNAATSVEQAFRLADLEANPPPIQAAPQRSEAAQQTRNHDSGDCLDFAAENAPDLPNRVPLSVQEIVYEFRASVADSAPVQLVWQQWSECMGSSGYHYADRQAIAQDFEQRSSPVQMAIMNGGTQLPSQELLAELGAQIDEIQAIESAVIDADVACSTEVALDDRIGEIVYQAEREFVEAQGDRLLAAAES